MDDIEPLEPVLWFDAVANLAQRLESTGADELESRLRHAYHLLQLTPRPLRSAISLKLNETQFEQLLESKAFKAAAQALADSSMADIVSKFDADLFEPQGKAPRQSESATVRHDDPTAALLSAWAQRLSALKERSLTLQTEYLHPIQHEARSERRRQQTVH